jgi:HK97 family phage portal protein
MKWFSRREKAIHERFEVKHATFLYGIGAARWLERRFDVLAQEGYEKNPIVYGCVSKAAKACASVDMQLYRRKGKTLTKLEDHPLLDLLNRPNPLNGGRKFMETLVTYYLTGGNSYLHGVGIEPKSKKPPRELWVLPTQLVTVDTKSRRMIPDAFDYRPGDQQAQRFPVDPITGRSAICHLKTVNMLNPAIGLPPLVAAAYGVDVFNAGQEWNKALLDNEARPSGALEFVDREGKPISLTDDQRREVRSSVDESFSGKANAGRPLILEGGMKWVPLSITPKDMDHRETMLTNARFIAGVYHTPPQLVNIPGESTYSNYGEAKLAYWADTVLPLLGTILEELGNWLTPFYGDDLFLWYDEEMVPALEPLRKQKADRVNAATYMMVNEKRRAMGLDDAPGGNVVLVPSGNIPLELAGAVDLPEIGSPADEEPEEDDDEGSEE